jgi:hypothetical protein
MKVLQYSLGGSKQVGKSANMEYMNNNEDGLYTNTPNPTGY